MFAFIMQFQCFVLLAGGFEKKKQKTKNKKKQQKNKGYV